MASLGYLPDLPGTGGPGVSAETVEPVAEDRPRIRQNSRIPETGGEERLHRPDLHRERQTEIRCWISVPLQSGGCGQSDWRLAEQAQSVSEPRPDCLRKARNRVGQP